MLVDPNTGDERTFTFDYSFWSHDSFRVDDNGIFVPTSPKYADQNVVYEALGKQVLDNAWEGYNCCLFAYGQTGSGKSYSMVRANACIYMNLHTYALFSNCLYRSVMGLTLESCPSPAHRYSSVFEPPLVRIDHIRFSSQFSRSITRGCRTCSPIRTEDQKEASKFASTKRWACTCKTSVNTPLTATRKLKRKWMRAREISRLVQHR